jgi:hypothetical protein
MKKNFLFLCIALLMASCKVMTTYTIDHGELNQTSVVLSNANFTILGHFHGTVSEKKLKKNIQEMEGLISKAKTKLYESAKSSGVEMDGSRTLVNVAVDIVQNNKWVSVTVSGDVIEYFK